MKPGRVILVGAGPGDPELLTLKAVRALREADVVLHDELVAQGVLDFIRPQARRVEVGKRGGCVSTPQAFIEQLLIREARAGNTVVRLKGGDPYVFGRGSEEVASLHAAGIAVEVVIGITSGLAAPAALGIPVTDRHLAHGVALITGHLAQGEADHRDWRALANSGLTLVIYMGMSRAHYLRGRLLAAGLAAHTPVAVIANATLAIQAQIVATLGDFVEIAQAAGLTSPAIIVIGKVVARSASQPLARIVESKAG